MFHAAGTHTWVVHKRSVGQDMVGAGVLQPHGRKFGAQLLDPMGKEGIARYR